MPADVPQPTTRPITVRPSVVNEFVFSLFILQRSCEGPARWTQPWVQEMQANRADLANRTLDFWQDGFPEWSELLLLAFWSGHLWDDDLDGLLAELPEIAMQPFTAPPLPSEGHEVQPLLSARLARLQQDAALREDYVSLLRELWSVIRPFWEGGARRQAEEQADDLRRRIGRSSDFLPLLPANHFARREMHQALVAEAVARGEAVLVPLALAGVGMGFFALPGVLIIAMGPEAGHEDTQKRERAERVASRLKVLSDPTRVSILRSVIHYPYSITDLAQAYDLSQPTVSVHVKLLREAGLLESYKELGHTMYRSSRDKVREFVGGAVDDLLG